MMLFALFVISIYALAVIILPFPHWPSFLHVLKETLISPYPTVRQRVSMLCYLVRKFACPQSMALIVPAARRGELLREARVVQNNVTSLPVHPPIYPGATSLDYRQT